MFTKKIWQSGNHGRVANSQNGTEPKAEDIMVAGAPKVSSRPFIPPGTKPVTKIPSIKEIVDPVSPAPIAAKPEKEIPESVKVEQTVNADSAVETENEMPTTDAAPETAEQKETFPEQWNKMFELIFGKIPTIYYPLKGTVPVLKDKIIHIAVKNEIQKEHFEARIRPAIDYLRNNCKIDVDSMVVTVNEQIENKKIIYDVADKIKNLQDQNSDLQEFLGILNLKPKDN